MVHELRSQNLLKVLWLSMFICKNHFLAPWFQLPFKNSLSYLIWMWDRKYPIIVFITSRLDMTMLGKWNGSIVEARKILRLLCFFVSGHLLCVLLVAVYAFEQQMCRESRSIVMFDLLHVRIGKPLIILSHQLQVRKVLYWYLCPHSGSALPIILFSYPCFDWTYPPFSQ